MHFHGYSEESKGYWLYNPDSERLIIRRDVISNEDDAWNWYNEDKLPVCVHKRNTSFEPPLSSSIP